MFSQYNSECKKLSGRVLKIQIKELNEKIRFLKSNLKFSKRINNVEIQVYFKNRYEYFLTRYPNSQWEPIFDIQAELRVLSHDVRKKHVVYSMLKGNDYSVIEGNSRTPFTESQLNRYIKEELDYAKKVLILEEGKNNG